MATVEAAREVMKEACKRAAKLWELPEDAVEYTDGAVRPAGPNAGKHEPMTLKEIAGIAGKTGGPIAGYARINAHGAAPSLATHICDVEVDPETGRAWVVRYTAIQDAGRAIHPSYVEGQYQGGVAQGIGWALNEEYIYDADGKLQNAGFLDYRVPVASDLPMIDTVIVEVPNPRHPYGVRGVGETPIVPPMAAVANAVAQRHRRALHRAADVAAQGAGGARRGPRQGYGEDVRHRRPSPSPLRGEGRGEGQRQTRSVGVCPPLTLTLSPRRGWGREEWTGPMAHVTLIGNLRQFTGGVTELDVEAATVRQLFARLGEKYPELAPHLETGSAVAIDGQIYQDALFQEIAPDSDVHILPQIAGG